MAHVKTLAFILFMPRGKPSTVIKLMVNAKKNEYSLPLNVPPITLRAHNSDLY
jgi:hypothetical protein